MWKKYGGYVILQIQGLGLGRFLRRLLFSGIPVFDIRRTDETTATLRIYAADFARLLPIRRRERCRIRMLRKYGMAFRVRKMLQRPALLVGIPLSAILLWSLCARIWLIRVEGTQRVSEDEVLSLLAEHGLSVGKRPKGNVLILAADDLSARIKDAAWVELHRDGVVLTATVNEARPMHDAIDWSVPADLVAEKEATVLSIQTKRGKPLVSPGQTVYRGDVLIAGHVVYSPDRTAYDTRADGVIKASCVYRAEAPFLRTVTEYSDTGETLTVRELRFCGFPLCKDAVPFAEYREDESTETTVSLFGLPVTVRKIAVHEIASIERVLTEREREEQAKLKAVDAAMDTVPHQAAICSIQVTTWTRDGEPFALCTVVTEETIGQIKEYTHE